MTKRKGKGKPMHRDNQIDAALHSGIEQMKSHAEVMKKVGAAHDALTKHRTLQQKHAAARGGGHTVPQNGVKATTRKHVSKRSP